MSWIKAGRPMKTYGTLIACLLGAMAPGSLAAPTDPIAVPSQHFDLEYSLEQHADPLHEVVLWYTMDDGASWQVYGTDEDRRSPMSVEAPHEGRIGLFLVAANATGPSSAPPTTNTKPQSWVLVDFTAPVVQLHSARTAVNGPQSTVQLQWTAIDVNFGPRPVNVEFRRPPGTNWEAVHADPIANSGRYDWDVPQEIIGPIGFRVTVFDQVGHRTVSEELIVEIDPPTVIEPSAVGRSQLAETTTASAYRVDRFVPVDDLAAPGSLAARLRAQELMDNAVAKRELGDVRGAAAELREAVRLDPRNATAFAEMGDTLYRLGDIQRAGEAYGLALGLSPASRGALRGMARLEAQNRDYAKAAERLRTILRYNPNDAEVWLNLGDVAVFQGNETLARECYLRAGQISPDATDIVTEARRRLELMAATSRRDGK
jgi:hypothetical protein